MASVLETIFGKQEKQNVGSTQEHLPIQSIHDNIVVLKDGSAVLVLQTTAVNFDLLSENEQLAIISSFAGMINSLSFAIQILIRSKRLDVTDYLNHLSDVEHKQKNPLLKDLMKRYRAFVENLTQQNEVLDKQFYVVIQLSNLELGIIGNAEKDMKKVLSLLNPRRDHVMSQLSRIGLKATQLTTAKLISLFYDIYNESYQQQDIQAFIDQKVVQENPTPPKIPQPKEMIQPAEVKPSPPPPPPPPQPQTPAPQVVNPSPPVVQTILTPPPLPAQQANLPQPLNPIPVPSPAKIKDPVFEPYYLETRIASQEPTDEKTTIDSLFNQQPSSRPTVPFIVEELIDEYGAAT